MNLTILSSDQSVDIISGLDDGGKEEAEEDEEEEEDAEEDNGEGDLLYPRFFFSSFLRP